MMMNPLSFREDVLERRWLATRHVFGFGGVSLRLVTFAFSGMAAFYLLLLLATATVLVDPEQEEELSNARWGLNAGERFAYFGLPYFLVSFTLLAFFVVTTLRVVGVRGGQEDPVRKERRGSAKDVSGDHGHSDGPKNKDEGGVRNRSETLVQRSSSRGEAKYWWMRLSWRVFVLLYPTMHVLYPVFTGAVRIQREYPAATAMIGSILVVASTVAGFVPTAMGMGLSALGAVLSVALTWPENSDGVLVIACATIVLALSIVIATAFFGERSERKGFEALVEVLEARSRAARIFSSVMPTHVARAIAQYDGADDGISAAASRIDDVDEATVILCMVDIAPHVREEMGPQSYTVFLTHLFSAMDRAVDRTRSHCISLRTVRMPSSRIGGGRGNRNTGVGGRGGAFSSHASAGSAQVDVAKVENQPDLYIAAAGLGGQSGSAHATWGCVLAMLLDDAVATFVNSMGTMQRNDVRLRTGIATGPVAGGLNGGSQAGAMVYSAYGDTVNTAARCAINRWDDELRGSGSGPDGGDGDATVPSTLSGPVQISETTLEKLRAELSTHMFAHRVRDHVVLKGKSASSRVGRIDGFSHIGLELIEMSRSNDQGQAKNLAGASELNTGRSLRSYFRAIPSARSAQSDENASIAGHASKPALPHPHPHLQVPGAHRKPPATRSSVFSARVDPAGLVVIRETVPATAAPKGVHAPITGGPGVVPADEDTTATHDFTKESTNAALLGGRAGGRGGDCSSRSRNSSTAVVTRVNPGVMDDLIAGIDAAQGLGGDPILVELTQSGRELLSAASSQSSASPDEIRESEEFEERSTAMYTRLISVSVALLLFLTALSSMLAIWNVRGADDETGFHFILSYFAAAFTIGVAPFLPVPSTAREVLILAPLTMVHIVRAFLTRKVIRDTNNASNFNLVTVLIVHALRTRAGYVATLLMFLVTSVPSFLQLLAPNTYTHADFSASEVDEGVGLSFATIFVYSVVLTFMSYLGVLRRRSISVQLRGRYRLIKQATSEGTKFVTLIAHALPPWCVDAFIAREDPIAEPISRSFPDAIVFQADIVSFTSLSEGSDPVEVLRMLHSVQCVFDRAAVRNTGVLKLGTVGDAYIAYTEGSSEAEVSAIVAFAEDAMRGLQQLPKFRGDREIHVRCGAAVGEMDTGIIGDRMPMFRGWGAVVDEAKHHEASGSPDRLNVSCNLHSLIVAAKIKSPIILFREDIES